MNMRPRIGPQVAFIKGSSKSSSFKISKIKGTILFASKSVPGKKNAEKSRKFHSFYFGDKLLERFK